MSAARAPAIAVAAALVVGVVVGGAAPARADMGPLQLAWAQYEASYVHRRAAADDPPAADDGLGLAGLRLRVLLGDDDLPVGYVAGLDLTAGYSRGPGFAYDVALFLAGSGVRLGDTGVLAVGAGVGASGATGSLDDAITLPVEAALQLQLGAHLRVLARARMSWLGAADHRQDGARSLAAADELDGALALRFGRHFRCNTCESGNGYFVGAAYREAEGARYLGVVIGHAIDIGAVDFRWLDEDEE